MSNESSFYPKFALAVSNPHYLSQFNVLGLKFNLKPGKFNIKEHTVIVVMSNAGSLPSPVYTSKEKKKD